MTLDHGCKKESPMETEGQVPTATNEGKTPADPTPATDTTPAAETNSEPKTFDETYVKTLRSEAASLRTKLKTFETEAEQRKTAAMSELEKAQKAAQDADARATATEQRMAKRDAIDALKAANIVDPDLAFLAIKDQMTLEDGEIKNLDALVLDFVKARPAMVKASAPTAPETKSTNVSTQTQTSPGREFVGRL